MSNYKFIDKSLMSDGVSFLYNIEVDGVQKCFTDSDVEAILLDNKIEGLHSTNSLAFIDYNWLNYSLLSHNVNKKKDQIHNLFYTQLCEGKTFGGEYCFIPLREFDEYEKAILEIYKKFNVVDNHTSICNEVYYTSKIEGSHTTYARTVEIHDGSPISHDDYFSEKMVEGGFKATKFLNLHNNKLNEDILLQMWNILVDGCCDNEVIRGDKYRIGDVAVGRYTGIRPQLIEESISLWIDYYNSDILNDHPFIKASLLHLAYEKIHPFCDGNGRSGRLLATNYLIGQGFEKCKTIAFTKNIAASINGYYNALDLCDNSYLDCTPFIQYMMESYFMTFQDIIA